jgi:hypothetical protein
MQAEDEKEVLLHALLALSLPTGLVIQGGSVGSGFSSAGWTGGSSLLAYMKASHSFHFISLRNRNQQ